MGSDKSKNWLLAITSIAGLMIGLDILAVSTSLNTIRLDLGASVSDLDWLLNAYNLAFAVLLMTGSALGDRFGRRRMFAVGLGLFTAASAAGGLAPGVGWLIAARTAQGAGAALISPLALSLISAAFPPARRGWALGISGGVTGLATLAGPVIGGAVSGGIGWEWIFWINVPIGLVAIPLVFHFIEESFGPDTSLDIAGLVLATGAVFGVVWGLMRGTSNGWANIEVFGALGAGVALAIMFVAWELRTSEPMLPMQFFRSRAFAGGNAATFLLFASMFSAVFLLAQFLQTVLGYGSLEAGVRLLPWTGTLLFIAPIAGSLSDRFGARPIMIVGLSLQAIGMGWLALIAEPGVAYSSVVLPLLVSGCGPSMVFPAVGSVVIGPVSSDEIGKASGVSSMIREIGGACGIAAAAVVFASAGGYASAESFTDGFADAIVVSAGLAVAGVMASLIVPNGRSSADDAVLMLSVVG